MIKAGLSCDVSDSSSPVVSAEDRVCRVPVPTGGDRGRGQVIPADNLSFRDVEELLVERGVEVDHVTVYRWVQRFLRHEVARGE
jgi:uroporphyrinogen-III synthase